MRRLLLYMRYLTVPARGVPLTLIVGFAILLTLAVKAGFLGIWLGLVLISWSLKYAFIAFDAVSRGFDEPPVLSTDMVNPANEQRPFGMMLIVFAFWGASGALGDVIGESATTVLRLVALALLPASLLTLAITGRIIDAVNPQLLTQLIGRLAFDYVLLIVLAVGLGFVVQTLSSLTLWLTAQFALVLYGILALFCLMGGIVYQRRDALGVDAWRAPERIAARDARDAARAFDRDMDELYGHWRGGAHLEAWDALMAKLAARDHDFDTYRRFHERLLQWPDQRLAERLAREFVERHGERASTLLAIPPRHRSAS